MSEERDKSKKKTSKWKVCKNSLKVINRNKKSETESDCLLDQDRTSEASMTPRSSVVEEMEKPSPSVHPPANPPVTIYYPSSKPQSEKSSKWTSLRNTMHFIRSAFTFICSKLNVCRVLKSVETQNEKQLISRGLSAESRSPSSII